MEKSNFKISKNSKNFKITNPTNKYISITLLRGLSVLLIILYHYTSRYNYKTEIIELGVQTIWDIDIWWGAAAVVTFFMMSGFLVGKSLLNQRTTLKSYLINRAFRLYPPFWAGIILTYIILLAYFPNAAVQPKSMLVNFTMIPYFFGYPCVDGAYWTMQIEFFFSLLLGFILFFNNFRLRIILLFLWLSLSFIFFFLPDITILKPVRFLLLPKYSHLFIAGIGAYFIINKKFIYHSYFLLILASFNQILYGESSIHVFFFFITLIILIFTNKIDARIKSTNILVIILSFFATISYSWYLIHQMIGYTVIKELQLGGYYSEYYILIPILITGGIAFIFYRFIELPASSLGKKISSMYFK